MGGDALDGGYRGGSQFHCISYLPVQKAVISVCSQDKGEAGLDDAGHIFADPAAVLPYLQGIGR